MIDLLIVSGLFAASTAATEYIVTRKLQSAFGRLLAVHAIGLALALGLVRVVDRSAVLVFWTGMLLAWFGLRSHLESSIVLQILFVLRDDPATRDEILRRYTRFGTGPRTDELVRGGYVVMDGDAFRPTRKGRVVARIASFLR